MFHDDGVSCIHLMLGRYAILAQVKYVDPTVRNTTASQNPEILENKQPN